MSIRLFPGSYSRDVFFLSTGKRALTGGGVGGAYQRQLTV